MTYYDRRSVIIVEHQDALKKIGRDNLDECLKYMSTQDLSIMDAIVLLRSVFYLEIYESKCLVESSPHWQDVVHEQTGWIDELEDLIKDVES